MKKLVVIVGIISMSILSCKNDDDGILPSQKQFLVDKVYDYNNNLLAEYFYNGNNQLILRKDTDPVNDKSSSYEFGYENNRIEKINYIDNTFPQFSYTINVYYNEQDQISKDEILKGGQIISERYYTYYQNGKLQGILGENDTNVVTYYYDQDNVEKVGLWDNNGDGDMTEIFYYYQYDSGQRPDFGIGKIFQYEPWPYFGTEAALPMNLSHNNMTLNLQSGTQWLYEYNEHDLPKTIEVKWDGVETVEPLMWRIKYKSVE